MSLSKFKNYKANQVCKIYLLKKSRSCKSIRDMGTKVYRQMRGTCKVRLLEHHYPESKACDVTHPPPPRNSVAELLMLYWVISVAIFHSFVMAPKTLRVREMLGCNCTPGVEKWLRSFPEDAIIRNVWLQNFPRSDGASQPQYRKNMLFSFYFTNAKLYTFLQID